MPLEQKAHYLEDAFLNGMRAYANAEMHSSSAFAARAAAVTNQAISVSFSSQLWRVCGGPDRYAPQATGPATSIHPQAVARLARR